MSTTKPLVFPYEDEKLIVIKYTEEIKEIIALIEGPVIPLEYNDSVNRLGVAVLLTSSDREILSNASEAAYIKMKKEVENIGDFPDIWSAGIWCYRDADRYPQLRHLRRLDSSRLLFNIIQDKLTEMKFRVQYGKSMNELAKCEERHRRRFHFGRILSTDELVKIYYPDTRLMDMRTRQTMYQLEYTIKGYIKELLLEKPGMFHAMFNVLRYGFYPLTWRGPYPEGYCLAVHLPFDQPAPPVPPECQPSPEVLKKYAKPPKHPKPIAITAPEMPALPASSWSDLIVRSRAPGGTATVFREHFSVLAETDACRAVLDRIAAIATGFRKDGKDLVVDFPGESFAKADTGEPNAPTISRSLRCPQPYTGAIAGLPPSCVAVIRRHNGITLHTDTSDPNETNTELGWHVYKKPRFQLEADVWFSPDEWDPDELFMTVPQVPIHGESDIWLLHPQRLRADNEPAVVRMSHDFGSLCNPAPYGAGGVFLRLLAHALGLESGAGDLWDDGR